MLKGVLSEGVSKRFVTESKTIADKWEGRGERRGEEIGGEGIWGEWWWVNVCVIEVC